MTEDITNKELLVAISDKVDTTVQDIYKDLGRVEGKLDAHVDDDERHQELSKSVKGIILAVTGLLALILPYIAYVA